jgi:ubiquinone/menaquinone biosynthesis C-methylase UbiE
MQTLTLARLCPECSITACDIHQPFLDDLQERAMKEGLDTRIKTVRASMDDLPFGQETFDLIWAEGSAFIMGFKEALHTWKRLLKPGGHMAISDCDWFSKPLLRSAGSTSLQFILRCFMKRKRK